MILPAIPPQTLRILRQMHDAIAFTRFRTHCRHDHHGRPAPANDGA